VLVHRQIDPTPDFWRIRALPRREWFPEQAAQLVDYLTMLLRTPMGRMRLRPVQAIALIELQQIRGLFGVMRVGSGKTLITLLAPHMVKAQRPLLLVPAKLKRKTRNDLLELSSHWYIARNLRIESYELLGRMQANEMLLRYEPDLIIADECHKLRNRKAAVTRRVARYMRVKPETMFVAMSGTITKNSLRDYSRILRWCLKPEHAPIPQQENELEEWSDALDENVNELRRMHPGVLLSFARTQYTDDWTTARVAYRERLKETQGVVATESTPIDCTLTVAPIEPEMQSITDDAIAYLRQHWETPDRWPIADALTMHRHVRELALGFYYRWNPRPPDEWYYPRKYWAAECRSILSASRIYDSEAQVVQAIIKGEIGSATYENWARVKNIFEPKTECVWLDDTVLNEASHWAQRPGIVWCEHVQFAKRLAQMSGLIYYGRKGESAFGRPIESANPKQACIASIVSNSEGRNLQRLFHRNLVTSPPANGPQWEQLFGRTHREGQRAHEVTVDVIMTCIEHYGAFNRAKAQANYVNQTQGQAQKLLEAQLLFPTETEVAQRTGARWQS
jgi:hypothetical protein